MKNINLKFLQFIILITITVTSFAATFPFNSLEEYAAWESKLPANFNPNYKVPDYVRVGASPLSSAETRYYFFKSNPQYLADWENIHKGLLSLEATDGSTLVKSKIDEMPEDIAEYYRSHIDELLAAEGFGFDPVLARKLYTGEITLPKNINKTQWLREHAWTAGGIIERDNVNYLNSLPYAGGYIQNKIDPTTGKIIDTPASNSASNNNEKPTSEANSNSSSGATTSEAQVKAQLLVLNSLQNELLKITKRAKLIKSSLELSILTNDKSLNSINCESENKAPFVARCKFLVKYNSEYISLNSKIEKLKKLILSIDSTVNFTKIELDTSSLKSTTVNKGTRDPFEADKNTPDCSTSEQTGWKCFETTITTDEGKNYKILLKWNRPNLKSKGSVFFGVGGTGTLDFLTNQNFKTAIDFLDKENEIRNISLIMLDTSTNMPDTSGYWMHGGGYETLAQIFMAAFEAAVNKGIIHGNFTNYIGRSNGTMLLASAMSRYDADIFIDRAVFQAGPFLTSLKTACNPKSASSFKLSTDAQQAMTQNFLSQWMYKDASKKVCDDLTNQRLSLIPDNNKKDYPYTKIHVIMGQKEETEGFGKWMLASNQEWFDKITANFKERIVRPNIGHEVSFEDVNRFLKLTPDEVADKTLETCTRRNVRDEDEKMVQMSCGCGNINDGKLQPNGCFIK